ncbi:MAG: AGE family epimerase/isomerase [Spirochaetales bacterium]
MSGPRSLDRESKVPKQEIRQIRERYERELFQQVIPFWERFSPDREAGGYFTCLDRDGTVFDTDKFTWMQAREVWTFSELACRCGERFPEKKNQWIELARLGAEFLYRYARTEEGYYFSLDRWGRPLVVPYNLFSDYFMLAAYASYYRLTGEEWVRKEGTFLWDLIQKRKSNPKGRWTKQIPGARSFLAMSFPMMDLWLYQVLQGFIPPETLRSLAETAKHQILHLHIDRKEKVVFERVGPDGSHPDCMEGRLLNPGHALETLWFLLRYADEQGDLDTVKEISEAMLWTAERGWDSLYSGFFYYQDWKGFPPEKLEADMKLWWVHVEALCAFLLGYRTTGDPRFWEWFRRVDAYTFSHFPDPSYGEWFGYLHRTGDPALSLKGGKWKGFFHIPRALMLCIEILRAWEEEG